MLSIAVKVELVYCAKKMFLRDNKAISQSKDLSESISFELFILFTAYIPERNHSNASYVRNHLGFNPL